MSIPQDQLVAEARTYGTQVDAYVENHPFLRRVNPDDMREGVTTYLQRGGKRLRPFLVAKCCEMFEGNEQMALPAAAAVELFHTWTLVHDDIIDRDDLRRGHPTLHRHYTQKAGDGHGLTGDLADHYGLSLSLLTGDVQQGFAITLLSDLHEHLDPLVVLALVRQMAGHLLIDIMGGEVRDVQFAMLARRRPSIDDIVQMIISKTASLLEFSALAGATIGKNRFTPETDEIRALCAYARHAGVAFQLQDDLLGVIGEEDQLGKRIGADLREGKYTTIIHFALETAQGKERARIVESLGEPDLSNQDVQELRQIFERLGAIQRTVEMAEEHHEKSLQALERLPRNDAWDYLESLAHYVVHRIS